MQRRRERRASLELERKLTGLTPAVRVAAGNDKAIQPVENGSAANIIGGQESSVYYGTYQQSKKQDGSDEYNIDPIKWRVLSNEKGVQSDNGDELFLLADQNLDVIRYHETNTSVSVTWAESTMRSWLNGYDASYNTGGNSGIDYSADAAHSFLDSAFSEEEKNAIAGTKVENSTGGETQVQIFLLSLSETRRTVYGFSRDISKDPGRVATNTAYVAGGGKTGSTLMSDEDGADIWWLRSPGLTGDYAAFAYNDGSVYSNGSHVNNENFAVRPAFKLNLEEVLFTSAAVGGKVPDASGSGNCGGVAVGEIFEIASYDGDDWKVTVLDKDRKFAISDVEISGDTVTFSYSGARTGKNEYISAVIVTNGELTHYGRVLELDGTANGESGNDKNVSIPSGMTLDADTELYLFNEQYNGGENDDTKLTDYASALCKAEDSAPFPSALEDGTLTEGCVSVPPVQTVAVENADQGNTGSH